MDLHVDLGAGDRLSARIYRQIADAVLDGRLPAGQRVPSSRELATTLGVARSTVTLAYEQLTAEGFLETRVGAGTYASSGALPRGRTRRRAAPRGAAISPRRSWQDAPPPLTVEGPPPRYDFSVGVPDAGLFPHATWRRFVARELRASARDSGGYGPPAGAVEARAAIARHVGTSRSVMAGPDDVICTQGAQQAFDLAARVLIDPGTRVAVEEPGYPPVRRLFASHGAQVVGVRVDDEGIVVDEIPADVRLLHVTPSHQFPLGVPMSLARRAALLSWARDRNALVIEDDYDSEFRFGQRPLEPLQSLDLEGRVLYVGSFSKTMLPSLRLGFLVAPPTLRSALVSARSLSDGHGDLVAQRSLARFIDEGELGRHLRRVSRVYAERHACISEQVAERLAPWFELVPSAAGLHLCARSRPGVALPLEDVQRRARQRGARVELLASYGSGPGPPTGLVIGYGAVATEDIVPGLDALVASVAG